MKVVQAILPIGTVLNGQYIVESLLGKGSFGNVYLVWEQDDKQKLFALAELINPKEQEGYRFTLEHVSHTPPNHRALPQAQSVFTDDKLGRTCLLVSYSEGPHLEILRLQQPEQRFLLPQVMTIMAPIMSAISHLHHRHPPVIHQNIKPTSILVPQTTGEPVLILLGIVKKQGFTTNPVPYFAPCYGAIEQYRGEFSTRTDVYGLGATFYILLTGIVPPDALYRSTQLDSTGIDLLKPVNEVVPTIPTFIAEAIQQAMALEDDHRFSSVEQFWEALWSLAEYPSSVSGDMPSALSHPSRVPRQAVVRPATISVPKQPRVPRIWKFGSFWPFAPKHRHAPQAGEPAVAEHTGEPPASGGRQNFTRSIYSNEAPPQGAGKLTPLLTARAWLVGASACLRPGRLGWSGSTQKSEPHLPASVPKQLICGLLALFIVLVFGGISLWFYAAASTPAHPAIVTPRPTVPAVVTPSSQPTRAPTTLPTTPVSRLPMVAGSYKGTIHNTPGDVTSTMSLTNIKQGGGKISGYFALGSGLLGDGFFSGTVDTARRIQFTVPGVSGNGSLHFTGIVQADGSLKGGYCSLDQTNHCNPGAGGYGTWNVKPMKAGQALSPSPFISLSVGGANFFKLFKQ